MLSAVRRGILFLFLSFSPFVPWWSLSYLIYLPPFYPSIVFCLCLCACPYTCEHYTKRRIKEKIEIRKERTMNSAVEGKEEQKSIFFFLPQNFFLCFFLSTFGLPMAVIVGPSFLLIVCTCCGKKRNTGARAVNLRPLYSFSIHPNRESFTVEVGTVFLPERRPKAVASFFLSLSSYSFLFLLFYFTYYVQQLLRSLAIIQTCR